MSAIDDEQGPTTENLKSSRPIHFSQTPSNTLPGDMKTPFDENFKSRYRHSGILELVPTQKGNGQIITLQPTSHSQQLLVGLTTETLPGDILSDFNQFRLISPTGLLKYLINFICLGHGDYDTIRFNNTRFLRGNLR